MLLTNFDVCSVKLQHMHFVGCGWGKLQFCTMHVFWTSSLGPDEELVHVLWPRTGGEPEAFVSKENVIATNSNKVFGLQQSC